MIVYDKFFALMEENSITRAWLRQNRIMSNASYDNITNRSGYLDGNTVNKLCAAFQCQPGDLMEYVQSPIDDEIPVAIGADVQQRGRPRVQNTKK